MDKHYDHLLYEKQVQNKWDEEKTYDKSNFKGPLYSIDTPPPTVSGALHIGHIFSYTQTDILARYMRMKGFSVFYPFGFDDNGLPTERYVEKKQGVSAYSLGRSAFIARCLEETHAAQLQFTQLWKRMGLSADWSNCYSTISKPVRKISQESFLRLLQKNLIYRKFEPALYCTTCYTSVAQAELDDAQKDSFFNTVAFQTEDGTPLHIGTTRPEFLPSCAAILYHPADARYTNLVGKRAVVPIFNITVPIIADEQVMPEKGTGLVMSCAFGDKTDIYWIKKYNLIPKQAIGTDGRWTVHTGILAGLKVHEARKKILEELQKEGLLKEQKPITHAVNIHERCKKEIEYIAISQWFLKILEHKQTFLALADKINWYPAFMKSRYINWVENLQWDWCLSRQRFFGIPFPVWHCNDCTAIITPDIKDLPIDPQETMYPGKECSHCKSTNITPDTDVMDTWNTSSLTPYICYGIYNPAATSVFDDAGISSFIPMNMRPQAHDIIRTWAFYTIVKAAFHTQQIPWHDIVISGHVLADTKEKLSKSQEQKKLDPEHLLSTYPADVIRYWTASASLGNDVLFSETQLKIGQKLLTKLWNAFRFIQEHTADARIELSETHGIVNEWIINQAHDSAVLYQKYLDKHEFNLALDVIEKFFWHDFCDNYLELIKDQLFHPEQYDSQEVEATKNTLYTIGLYIVQHYAPYLPHITEILYGDLYSARCKISSIHQMSFMNIIVHERYVSSSMIVESLLTIINKVRKLKTEEELSLKTEIAELIIYSKNKELLESLSGAAQIVKGITKAQQLSFINQRNDISLLTTQPQSVTIEISLDI
jgi:valyl-tRNA synthetase